MLSFADTPWHVISNALAFLLGLSFAFMQRRVFRLQLNYAVVLYLWHTLLCIYYYYYSVNNVSDSTIYYMYSLDLDVPFGFGTVSLYYLTAIFSDFLNMSYFGVFMIYNIFGYIGLIAFSSALLAMTRGRRIGVQRAALALPLLPSLSFWSAAIGKDALAFMAAGLICWGVHNVRKRYYALIVATALFIMVRPHVAAVLISSVAIAFILAMKTRLPTKIFFSALCIPAAAVAVYFGAEYAGLGIGTSTLDLTEYVSARQQSNLEGGSSVDIASMNVPARMFTYAFRPLFIDAAGMLGLVVSFENLALLLIFILSMIHLAKRPLILPNFETMFFMLFCLVSWLLLANTTANLGIAVRQKWMFMPMLLMLMMSSIAGSSARYWPPGMALQARPKRI